MDAIPEPRLLLSGAPGTGKSTFPKLLANSLGIDLVVTGPGLWTSSGHLGDALKAMSRDFDKARLKPTVLFIDEMDSVSNRGMERSGYGIQFTNHFLQLVSEASLVEGLVMVGATNYPARLDPALLRSGRFGTHIVLELPDEATRATILRQYAGISAWEKQLRVISLQVAGYSGADIEKLVSLAKAHARRKGEAFTHQHIHEQIKQRDARLSSDQRRRLRAYDAGKAIVREALGIVTTSLMPPTTRTELADHLVYLMAGRAAEEVLFSEVSDLGVADLKAATSLAIAMERELGMGESGLIHLIGGHFNALGSPSVTGSVRRHIETAMERASRILSENTRELHRRLGRSLFRGTLVAAAGTTDLVH